MNMPKPFLQELFILICLAAGLAEPGVALAAGGDILWEKTYGISSYNLTTTKVVVDTTGTYAIGCVRTTDCLQWRIEKRDLNNGVLLWEKTYDGGYQGSPYDIAIDNTGVYTIGVLYNFPPGWNYLWRIEKRDLNNGNLLWEKTAGVSGLDLYNLPTSILIDTSGVYMTGSFEISDEDYQYHIEKRNLNNGNLIWEKTLGGSSGAGTETIKGVSVDNTGVYSIGQRYLGGFIYEGFVEKRNLGDGSLVWDKTTTEITSIGEYVDGITDNTGVYLLGRNKDYKLFIEKRDLNSGTLLWGQTYTNSTYSTPIKLAINGAGVYIAGYEGSPEKWIVEKRDLNDGTMLWTKTYTGGDTNVNRTASIAIDNAGVYTAGSSEALAEYTKWRVEKRNLDDGTLLWEKIYTDNISNISAISVALDSTGVYTLGSDSSCGVGGWCWRIEKRESGGSPPPPPPTVNLSAFPATINSGESSTLSWTTTDATACDDVPLPEWLAGPVGTAGSEVEWPTATTTYTISCTGPGGTTQQSTTVTVTAPCVPGWGTTTVDSAGSVGYNPSLAIGTDGFPAIAYSGSADLKVVKCSDAGCSSGNTFTVVDSIGSIWTPSLAIGTDGFPVIAYDIQNLPYNLKVAKCGNAGCSSGNTLTIVDSVAGNGLNPSIAIGTDGFPVIAYSTATWGVKLAKCGNTSCSSGNTIVTVDSVGWKPSLAIGTDGFPVIVYSDNTASSIKVAKCGNAGCNSGNTLTTVDSVGINDYTPSLAIGTDGFPVIAYRTATFDLKVAKCGNTSCSSGNTFTIVDSIGNVGAYSSLTIGTNGFPAIAYFDITNYNIKLAKCGNAGCNSGNTLTAVDSYGIGFGANSSIGIDIGTDGFPVVAYLDNANYDLKVAKESGCGGTPAPTVNLSANPSTINGGEYSDLTWSSTNAVSCAAVYPAGWTSQTGTSGTERLYPASTTIYTISCTGAGGTTYQATTVTVNAPPAGNDCGLRMFDGTSTIILDCETPASTTSLRIYNNGTISGIKLVDPADANASRFRIAVPDGGGGTVIKALRKQ